MTDPKEGETCDAFVPLHLRDAEEVLKAVGPPIGEPSEDC